MTDSTQPAEIRKPRRRPNTARALAKALHRYAGIDEPAAVFDAVCADWPHRIAVLINDYLFYEIDESDLDETITIMERDLKKLRAFRAAYPDLKKRKRSQPPAPQRRAA